MLYTLTFLLSFFSGGFYGYTAAVCGAVLAALLIRKLSHNKTLTLRCNSNTLALAAVVVCACVSPLWAYDKGMAPFGLLRWLPSALYAMYLMQCSEKEREGALAAVPVSGAVMTLLSAMLALIPGTQELVTVNGRLAGFFQYPNTFAIFLLAGVILQHSRKSTPSGIAITGALLCGIILSGSRTVFVLLIGTVVVLLALRKDGRVPLIAGFAAAMALGLAVSHWGLLENADRYTGVSPTAGTFLVRLLYDKDALPLIAAHPAGLGYLGYRAVQGSMQTGRYFVTYVHNGFFQLLLDWGWIGGGLLSLCYLRRLFSRDIRTHHRLLLAVLIAHCLLDYDTEFLSIRLLLLTLLDFESGKTLTLSRRSIVGTIAASMAAVCLWLGFAEGCYYAGRTDLCRKAAPFHTDAMAYDLSHSEDPAAAEALADKILACNPRHTLAWNAKANAAFLRGDMDTMWEYKQAAIRSDRYAMEEYCDAIQKLYTAAQVYSRMGAVSLTETCLDRILEIPAMLEAVEASTDPLAFRTGDDPSMTLPEEYQALIMELSRAK